MQLDILSKILTNFNEIHSKLTKSGCRKNSHIILCMQYVHLLS